MTDQKKEKGYMSEIYDKVRNIVIDTRSDLPGREQFYKQTESLFKSKDVDSIVLVTIEVDELEFFLRMFGPVIRDDLIQEAAERIKDSVGGEERLYHITQFRFALVLTNISHRQAINITKSLVSSLRHPFKISGVAIDIPPVVGFSHYPNHADNLYELVRTVAFATHLARKNRVDYSSYDKKLDDWEQYQFRLLKDIDNALDNSDELKLAYQPIINLRDGSCKKFEGLCRWEHKELGFVNPEAFIPYVELSPLILPLTEVTLGYSLEFNKMLHSRGHECVISVNLSTCLFKNSDLVQKLYEQFQFYGVSAENVIFEITETGIMENPESMIYSLNRLKELGSKIAIDDFGTGHSSLAYLADLPMDILKIDRHFINDISKDRNQAIVGATVKIAESLGVDVIAEGIETQEQMNRCLDLGVTYGQGYYICKPGFSGEALAWLEARKE